MASLTELDSPCLSTTAQIALSFTHRDSISEGFESQAFRKPNKHFPTYNLIQKIWNKAKHMQRVTSFTKYSPIWHNTSYEELAKLQQGARWKHFGVTHLHHIFKDGALLSFCELQIVFASPMFMYYYYAQLHNAIRAQGDKPEWRQSPSPLFNLISTARSSKDSISQCYSMFMSEYLMKYPMRVQVQWGKDLGPMSGDQWEEALEAVTTCSLNVSQCVLLRIYYTSVRLYGMGTFTLVMSQTLSLLEGGC